MTDDRDLTPHERDLFARLPRHAPSGDAGAVLAALRAERHVTLRPRWMSASLRIAAAFALLAVGAIGGSQFERRRALEGLLARDDLPMAERVLLLQRAGSAYVRAAHNYAAATAQSDSTAVEVASQVLRGAASALQKTSLSTPLSSGLVSVLQTSDDRRPRTIHWY